MTDADLERSSSWFLVEADGAQSGPFTLEQLAEAVALNDRDKVRVWCEFLNDWMPIDEVVPVARACDQYLQPSAQPHPQRLDAYGLPVETPTSSLRPPSRVKFSDFVEVHALESFRSTAPALVVPAAASLGTATGAAQTAAATSTAGGRVQAALTAMNAALVQIAAAPRRRPLLAFPVLDLRQYIEDLERTAFASLPEDAILAQLCLEVNKEREAFAALSEDQYRQAHERHLSAAMAQTADQVAAVDNLEREAGAVLDHAFLTLQTESASAAEYGDLGPYRAQLDAAIASHRSEVQYLRRLADRHRHLGQHAALHAYYRTLVLALMQYLLGMRLLRRCLGGPDKDRYKARINGDSVLKVLVKKGLEIQGQVCAVARGDAATILETVLDALLGTIHANHTVLKASYQHASDSVRLAAAIQTCADTIAQTLALRYEEQIRMLTCRSAQTLAEFGLRAMFNLMSKGIPFPADNRNISLMVSHVVASVQDESTLNKGSKIFAKKEKLLTIRGPEKDTWNAVGIYRKSGVRFYVDKGDPGQRFFEGGLFSANPGKYGYRLGNLSECETLRMVETTPSRHRPDMDAGCYDSQDRISNVGSFVLNTDPARAQAGTTTARETATSFEEKLLLLDDEPKSSSDVESRLEGLREAVERLSQENCNLRYELDHIRLVLQQAGFQI